MLEREQRRVERKGRRVGRMLEREEGRVERKGRMVGRMLGRKGRREIREMEEWKGR